MNVTYIIIIIVIIVFILSGLLYSLNRKNTGTTGTTGTEKYRRAPCQADTRIGRNANYQDIYNFGRAAQLEFLDYIRSKPIFDKYSTCHLMTPEEIQHKLSGAPVPTWTNKRSQWVDMCLQSYSDCLLNFHPHEIKAISELYYQSNISVPSSIPKIRFIKITGNLDWNYPFTIGDAIVLPKDYIERIRRGFMSPDEFASLINHELIHIDQRIRQADYNDIYNEVGALQVPVSKLITSVRLAVNPDDPMNMKTLYHIKDNIYILTSLVYDSRLLLSAPVQMAIEVLKRPDGQYIQKNENSYWLLNDCPYNNEIIKKWKKKFPNMTLKKFLDNGYSANEIMATHNS